MKWSLIIIIIMLDPKYLVHWGQSQGHLGLWIDIVKHSITSIYVSSLGYTQSGGKPKTGTIGRVMAMLRRGDAIDEDDDDSLRHLSISFVVLSDSVLFFASFWAAVPYSVG